MVPNLRELFFSFALLYTQEKYANIASSKHRNRHGEDIGTDGETKNPKTMKEANSSKQNMVATQKIAGCRRAKEPKARCKVNEDWQKIESTGKYRKAALRCIGWDATDRIAEEVLDGIFLNLNTRNGDKSASEQKRLLRRIVEKRQAQAAHTKTRKSRDRKTAVAVIINTSKCMERLYRLRFAC